MRGGCGTKSWPRCNGGSGLNLLQPYQNRLRTLVKRCRGVHLFVINKFRPLPQREAGLWLDEAIIDSTTMKVHCHGGGQKGGFRARGVAGWDKHEGAPCCGGRRASCVRVSPRGNRNDAKAAPELAEEVYGCHVLGDRGYDSDKLRRLLE